MFQSTHSRGVRLPMFRQHIYYLNVSIHALTRSATDMQFGPYSETRVSIHALTRSATGHTLSSLRRPGSFNPRTHEECDIWSATGRKSTVAFQSTHSRGVRPSHAMTRASMAVSIHALTRSATWPLPVAPSHWQFQSTHSRGVRRFLIC